MNHKLNSIYWPRGSIVIHDADAKEPKMLMRVVGYTRDKGIKTKYIYPHLPKREYVNDHYFLLDPEQFNIPVEIATMTGELRYKAQLEWERVRQWNNRYPIGIRVKTTSADGGFETVTTGRAYFARDCSAWITLAQGGNWLLQFVEVVSW